MAANTDVLESVQAAAAVGESEAESVSAYVNDALRLKAEHDRKLRGIDGFIAACEAGHGEITEKEMEAAYRRAKARAIASLKTETTTSSPLIPPTCSL
jgi:hypothetical protein